MSMFQTINNEKYELVHFEVLLFEVSKQENISFAEACAVIAREASWHLEGIPFNEPFIYMTMMLLTGLIRMIAFQINRLIS